MKKSKILIVIVLAVLLLTGCTKQFKDADNQLVTVKETKQTLISNVICKPVELKEEYEEAFEKKEKTLNKKYKAGDISKKQYNKSIKNLKEDIKKFNKLPSCTKFTPMSGGYETFWTTFFVKPLAWVIIQIGNLLGNQYAWGLIIVTILIRLILLL